MSLDRHALEVALSEAQAQLLAISLGPQPATVDEVRVLQRRVAALTELLLTLP